MSASCAGVTVSSLASQRLRLRKGGLLSRPDRYNASEGILHDQKRHRDSDFVNGADLPVLGVVAVRSEADAELVV